MKRAIGAVLTVVLTVTLLACQGSDGEWTGTFVRYDKAADGATVAIVRGPAGDPQEIRAVVEIDDLKPGETLILRAAGRDWDQPQSTPDNVVMRRAGEQ